MKYVVLKNSHSILCVQLPEGFGSNLGIVCFENQAEFDGFLKEAPTGVCQIGFPQSGAGMIEEQGDPVHDGLFIRQNDFFNRLVYKKAVSSSVLKKNPCIFAKNILNSKRRNRKLCFLCLKTTYGNRENTNQWIVSFYAMYIFAERYSAMDASPTGESLEAFFGDTFSSGGYHVFYPYF